MTNRLRISESAEPIPDYERLREAAEDLFLYEPGREGHAAAMHRLREALGETGTDWRKLYGAGEPL